MANRWSIEDVTAAPDRLQLVSELLLQLADDDFLIGFRDQEWLGLAPHIEEDVAFGSIAQEELGHAAHYYEILERLGRGRADDLASLREDGARRNSVLLEQPNGSGDYLDEPHYDWAWTIGRHYVHDVWEMTVLTALQESIFEPLAHAAQKIVPEKRYHLAHQELWLRKMASHDDASRQRLVQALDYVAQWGNDLADFGPIGRDVEETGLVPQASQLCARYEAETERFFGELGINPLHFRAGGPNGRRGEHTPSLTQALAMLSEVYRLDPQAHW